MTMTDPLGDMLTRIRNAQMRRKQYVLTPNSKLRAWVLDVLKSEGYIRSYDIEKNVAGTDYIKVARWRAGDKRTQACVHSRSKGVSRSG